MGTIQSFTDLEAWKQGHRLVLAIYKHTKHFPREETFGLTSQMRRAAISITSNIAEGFSRYSYAEKKQFYAMSLGSLTEVQNQLLVAKDVDYLPKAVFEDLAQLTVTISKLLNGLLKKTKSIIHNS